MVFSYELKYMQYMQYMHDDDDDDDVYSLYIKVSRNYTNDI